MASGLVRFGGGDLAAAGTFAVEHAKKAAKKTAKKAAKKVAKKAAKKSAKHVGEPQGKDELRAFGHLWRVGSLCGYVADETLAGIADELVSLARVNDSVTGRAELLRCTEHVLFAGLQLGREHPVHMNPKLEEQISLEYRKLMDRYAAHDLTKDLQRVGEKIRAVAESAYHDGEMASALELARAAEALGHVGSQG